jgi:hypothetical protein
VTYRARRPEGPDTDHGKQEQTGWRRTTNYRILDLRNRWTAGSTSGKLTTQPLHGQRHRNRGCSCNVGSAPVRPRQGLRLDRSAQDCDQGAKSADPRPGPQRKDHTAELDGSPREPVLRHRDTTDDEAGRRPPHPHAEHPSRSDRSRCRGSRCRGTVAEEATATAAGSRPGAQHLSAGVTHSGPVPTPPPTPGS